MRRVLAWLPAVLVVPVALGGAVRLAQPVETAPELRRLHPVEPGTTWVYDVYADGEPSGSRVRQVLGEAQVEVPAGEGTAIREAVRISSRYDDHPQQGASTTTSYLGVDAAEMTQYAISFGADHVTFAPAAPAYRLPLEPGETWSYDGKLGSTEVRYRTELVERTEVVLGDHTFTDCAHLRTELRIGPADRAQPQIAEEWTCPDVGPVRFTETVAATGVVVTEELRELHGPRGNWWAAPPQAAPAAGSLEADGPDGPDDPGDLARTRAVADRRVARTPAWTELRGERTTLPVVSDDEVLVTVDRDGVVAARDVATGEARWKVRLDGPVVVPPALMQGRVLVADAAKQLWALDTVDGRALWVHTFDDVVSATPTPTADGSALAVPVEDGTVTALDLLDGSARWDVDLDAAVRTPPAAIDDLLLVGDHGGGLTALDAADGRTRWSESLDAGLVQGPALVDGRVLVVDDGGVVRCFDADDGTVLWEARGRGWTDEPLAVAGGVVVAPGEDRVDAIDLVSGDLLWSRRLDDATAGAVVVGDEVVAVTDRGRVQALGLADGEPRDAWAVPRSSPEARLAVAVPPALVGDHLVVSLDVDSTSHDAALVAYPVTADGAAGAGAAPRGGARWTTQTRAVPFTPSAAPVLDGDGLLVAGEDATIRRSTGLMDTTPVAKASAPVIGLAAADGTLVYPDGDRVRAVDATTGAERWSFPATEPYPGSVPVVAGDTAYLPLHGAGLAAVSLADGAPRWLTPIPGGTGSMPPLPVPRPGSGTDVVSAVDALARYDGETGEELWRLARAGVSFANAAYADGIVHAALVEQTGDGGERATQVAVDAATGRELWSRPMAAGAFFAGTAAADGFVVLIDGAGLVTVRDARTGRLRWSLRLGTPPAGPPYVRDGMVLLTESGRAEDLFQRDYRVTAHDLATGTYLGSLEPPGPAYSILPTVAGAGDSLLVPATSELGSVVLEVEAHRD